MAVVRRALNHSSEVGTLIYALADQQLQAKYSRRRGKKAAKKCRLWLTGRGEQCILDSAMLSGDDVTIAERNNKPYFVALDGGAQTPFNLTPSNATK